MTYKRVIPRDLFNESGLLKCYGKLWIHLDNIPGHAASLGDAEGEHSGAAFEIAQDDGDGSISVANVPFTIRGRRFTLSRPLNSREPWPLYATDDDDEETAVFTNDGELSPEFLQLIGAPNV